eukprot:scaffold38869_cov41-Phaeocystis_antarctica.AAC.2
MDLPPRQAPSPSSAELYLLTARCDSRTLRDETSSAAILRPAKSRSEACVRSGVEERPSWKAKSAWTAKSRRDRSEIEELNDWGGRRSASNGAASRLHPNGGGSLLSARAGGGRGRLRGGPGQVSLWTGGAAASQGMHACTYMLRHAARQRGRCCRCPPPRRGARTLRWCVSAALGTAPPPVYAAATRSRSPLQQRGRPVAACAPRPDCRQGRHAARADASRPDERRSGLMNPVRPGSTVRSGSMDPVPGPRGGEARGGGGCGQRQRGLRRCLDLCR